MGNVLTRNNMENEPLTPPITNVQLNGMKDTDILKMIQWLESVVQDHEVRIRTLET